MTNVVLVSSLTFFKLKFLFDTPWKCQENTSRLNKRNDKHFSNRGYSLFFLIGIFLNHLWLIPNILKWQNCKIFTKLVPSQTLLRSSHRRCSVKTGVFKNLQKFTGKHLCCSLFLIKLQVFRPATLLNSDSNTDVFLWIFTKHLFWRTSAKDCFCSS